MHIAVCIDNTANRKQMERLLHRASDKRPPEQVFYIDSFGSVSAVMCKPKLYDLFLLDITEAQSTGLTLAFALRSAGVTCPIVLCPDVTDYRSQVAELTGEDGEIASTFLFLDQPVKAEELEQILCHAQQCLNNTIPTIELRAEKYTTYAREEEILYAKQVEDKVHVFLTNDRNVIFISTIRNFYSEIKNFRHILPLSETLLVHDSYISEIGLASVTLKNGVRFRTPLRVNQKLKKMGLPLS